MQRALSRINTHWRRFRPRHKTHGFYHRDKRIDRQYYVPKEAPDVVFNETDIYDLAEQKVVSLLQRRPEPRDLDREIVKVQTVFSKTHQPVDGLVALFAQLPRAVFAQIQMDKHPHGYRDKNDRLYELIDFNDTLDATVLAMTHDERQQFAEKVKRAGDRICKRIGAPTFREEQWDAIIRGLSREIAIYLAARDSGFRAVMTPRTHDALGIDMQIQDPETGRYINVDIKTPSAFRYRLEQLVKEDRLTEHELLLADERSYARVKNGKGHNRVEVILLCALPAKFGEVENFSFIDTAPMRDMLNFLIRDYGLSDGRFSLFSLGARPQVET